MRQTGILLLAVLWSAILVGSLQGGMLTIKEKRVAELPPKPSVNLGVSDRNLLDLDYSGKYQLPRTALSPDNPKVLKILAIKVNFRKEVVDDPLSTGDGTFDLRAKETFQAEEGHLIDPSPHNSEYFDAHLRALNEYWQVVSQGRLTLQWDIFPRQSDSAYQLDSAMAYYGLRPPWYGLGDFFFDAIRKADQDTAIQFYDEASMTEKYDAYVIFHAGSDQQNNRGSIWGPDTPADLYTGFVKIGVPFAVDSGRVIIYEGVIVPETPSQDGAVTALNAVFAHEFGHQLGLVDLYDTRTFKTMVGDFALMDHNGFGYNVDFGEDVPVLVFGVLPVFPCAWSRAYLGFVDIVEVTKVNNIDVAAAGYVSDKAKVLLVPINADEYFLVENRRTNLDDHEITGIMQDSATEVILYPRSPIPTERENNHEYDNLIPGSGMLIWHVDERVARMDYNGNGISNFDENHLQWFCYPDIIDTVISWDNHHRFLALEEADGFIDFDGEYISGYGPYGQQQDLFEINGNSTFGPHTNPSSTANNNGYTGITIADISASLRIMECDVHIDGHLPGWPNYIGGRAQPLVVYDLDGDGSKEIVTAIDNYILAYRFDGSSLFTPHSGEEVIVEREVYYGSGKVYDTLAVYGRVTNGRRINLPLACGDLDGDGFAEVVVVTDAATVACFTTAALSFTGEAIKLFEETTDAPVNVAPMLVDYDPQSAGTEILVINTVAEILVFDKNGNRLTGGSLDEAPSRVMADASGSFLLSIPDWEQGVPAAERKANPRGAAAADFDGDGEYETAAVYFNGTLIINYEELLLIDVGAPICSEMSLTDIDDDGLLEILFCGDNLIYAYNYNGTIVSDFPITVSHYIPAGPILTNPTVVDLDGDGSKELFVGTGNGELVGFDRQGNRLPRFPWAVGGRIETLPVFAGSGNGGGLFALTREGEINGFVSEPPTLIEWNALYGSAANLGSYTKELQPATKYDKAIGYVYNYPNPAGDHTTVRFGLKQESGITLRLYNMAGDLVFETGIEGWGIVDNEYVLDCTRFASGVYFCQLETESGEREYCTIAVMK